MANAKYITFPVPVLILESSQGGSSAEIGIKASLPKIAGGFLCANLMEVTATHVVTSPQPFYVSAS